MIDNQDGGARYVGGFASLTIADLIAVCWRRKWVAVPLGIMVAAGVFALSTKVTPMYEAAASLAVEPTGKSMDVSVDVQTERIDFGFVNTERDRLLAAPVLQQALEVSGLLEEVPYNTANDPVALLRSRLEVDTSRDSYVIDVRLQDESSARAEMALDVVLDSFLSLKTDRRAQRASGVLRWLTSEIAKTRDLVQKARADEQQFREEQQIVSDDPRDNHHARQLVKLSDIRSEMARRIAESRAQVEQIKRALASEDPQAALLEIEKINQNPIVLAQQQQLYELREQKVLLGQRFLGGHPRMIEIEGQIAINEEHLQQAIAMARAGMETTYAEHALKLEEIDREIARESAAMSAYRTALVGLQARAREVNTAEQMLDRLLTKQTEEEVASSLQAGMIDIIHPPHAGLYPVNIRRALFAAAAAICAMVTAVGVALVAELLDRRVRGGSQVVQLTGLEEFGVVPLVNSLFGTRAEEAFRHLRANLHLIHRQLQVHSLDGVSLGISLVFSSVNEEDGKTTLAVGSARALASAGQRVLLVDGNMRSPKVHEHFKVSAKRGLPYALSGDDIEPMPTNQKNLDLMPVGVSLPNPSELLHGRRLTDLLDIWRASYDYIIIDSPSLDKVSDGLLLINEADGALLVVRDRKTSKRALRWSLERLRHLRTPLLGFVLNGSKSDNYSSSGPVFSYNTEASGAASAGNKKTPRTVQSASPAADPRDEDAVIIYDDLR